MWRSVDGHTLSLSAPAASRLLHRLEPLGLYDAVRRNYRGDVRSAVGATVRQLVERARRRGSLLNRTTGCRYGVFSSALGSDRFRIVTRPDAQGVQAIVYVRGASAAEREDGDGARLANLEVLRAIWRNAKLTEDPDELRKALAVVRRGQAQVHSTKDATNNRAMPDTSYIGTNGQRVHIEVDTDPRQARKHMRDLRRFDKDAAIYSLIVDKGTGEVIGARVRIGNEPPKDITDPQRLKKIYAALPAAKQQPGSAPQTSDRDPQKGLRDHLAKGKPAHTYYAPRRKPAPRRRASTPTPRAKDKSRR